MAHPHEELVRRGFDAFAKGDMDTLRGLFADDIVWHSPGRNPLAGDHRTPDGVLRFFGAIMEASEGTFTADLQRVMVSDDGAAAVFQARGQRSGRILDTRNVLEYAIRDGKVTEVWAYWYDLHQGDDFLA
jgi:ketosteroid isomerase-like protein